MSIQNLITNYQYFLIHSWPYVSKTLDLLDWDATPHFLDHWMQANWELLVEKHIMSTNQFLAPYGYVIVSGGRYTNRHVKITHRVICNSKSDLSTSYYFLCFLTETDCGHKIEPPFDFISVENVETRLRSVIAFDDIEFSLNMLTDENKTL